MRHAPAFVTVSLALCAGAGWLTYNQLVSGLCGNTIVKVVPSPSGSWEAVLFERSCGATTGFSSQISILTKGAHLSNDPGNIFAAEGSPDRYVIRWNNESLLEVRGTGLASKAEDELSGIRIEYR